MSTAKSTVSNVVPLHGCGRCGSKFGEEVDVEHDGKVVATGRACAECLSKTLGELAQVRPVFDAMIACGVGRELANDTMTFMLDRMRSAAEVS